MKRSVETAQGRTQRLTENARKQRDCDAAADDDADESVRRSIEKHGP